jgi:cytochrome P450
MKTKRGIISVGVFWLVDVLLLPLGLLGNGLITSSGEKWRRNRKLLTPLFHMKTQKEMQQMMVLYTQDLLDTIETEGPEKYHLGFDLFGKYTLTQIVMLAFGGLVDINWMLEKQHQLGSAFFEYIKARFMFGASYKYLPVPTVRNIANLRSAIGEQTKSVIKQIKAELAKKKADGSIPADLLSTLLLSKDPATGQSIPEEDILEEAATMLFAGFDTSAVTLCWVMYHLAEDQERQEKLYRYASSSVVSSRYIILKEDLCFYCFFLAQRTGKSSR